MYISEAVRDGLCSAGAVVCAVFLLIGAAAILYPHVARQMRYMRERLKIRVWYFREYARIKRDTRRYKAAMRVFDKPIKWKER